MKKFALWTILSLSSLLSAQDIIKYEIEPTIGYNKFDGNSKMGNTFLYGIRGTIYPNRYYGYRLSYQSANNVKYSQSTHFSQKSTDLGRVSADILMSGEEEYNVIPYILLGGGYELLSDETAFDVNQGYIEGGLGFKYHMQNNFNLNLEAIALKKFDTNDVDYMVNLGLGYMFDPTSHTPEVNQPSVLDEKPIEVKPKSVEIQKQKPVIKPIAVKKDIDALYTFKDDTVKKHVSKKINSKTVKANKASNSSYYVQMDVWYKKQNEKLLNKIECGGYHFELKDAKRFNNKDVQLVLVGPYKSFSDAKTAYKKLRKIKKDAFITKI